MILLQLFLSFMQIGLFSIGGGYVAIPLIQSQTVDLHHWLTAEQFMDLATIAEMTPGPIALNGATFVGLRVAGMPGAVIATFGCILPSLFIASLLAFILGSQMNAFVMSKMKVATKGRGFGWRAILSTVVGELSDSVIFYPLAFAGVMPAKAILSIILTQVTVKTLYEVVILPVTSVIARRLKKAEGIDAYDYDISYNPFQLKEDGNR